MGAGELNRVQEGIGKGVTGCAPPNTEWHSKGRTMAGRRWISQGQQDQGVKDGVSGKDRPGDLPS